ncbi:MAG: ATP-binding protein [Chloroflexota bacterium]
MRAWFSNLLTPPRLSDDDEINRRARVLYVFGQISLLFLSLVVLGDLLGGRTPPLTILLDLLMMGNSVMLLIWIRRGWLNLAGWWLFVSGLLLATVGVGSVGTIRAPGAASYVLLVVCAGLVMGRRGMVLMTLGSSLAILVLALAERSGLLPPPDFTVTITQWITYTLLFALTGVLAQSAYQSIQASLAQARDALQFNQTILHAATVGIITFKASGECISVNQAAEQILGLPAAVLLKDDYHQLESWRSSGLYDAAQRLLAGEPPQPAVLKPITTRNGRQLWLKSSISPFNWAGDPHLLLIFEDETERHQAEMALRDAHDGLEQRVQQRTAELQEANRALGLALGSRDEFLAAVSHELRTPLTGILGMAEVLQFASFGALSEKQLHAVQMIETSGRRLHNLIDNVLDFSQLQSGCLDLYRQPVDLRQACQAALDAIQPQAAEKKQLLRFSFAPQQVRLQLDPLRFHQVLINLLDNAVKFTPPGGQVELSVTGEPAEAPAEAAAAPGAFAGPEIPAPRVRIRVHDSGIGIPAQDLPRLFSPFVQLDGRLARQFNGAGLGLALVKALVLLHGGSVDAESVPGQGSCFTITFPWPAE